MADDPNPAEEPPKKKSKLIIIVAGVTVLAVVGAALYMFVFSGDAEADAEVQEETASGPDFGPLVEINPIVVNLADSSGGRYLKLSIQLEVKNEEAKVTVEEAYVPIRDRLLVFFSGIGVEEALGEEGKSALKVILKEMINELLGAELVKNVYFTDFVIQ
ncbi:MAG: flagellar basal body-associated protein FliL [Myxococcota bacterium]